MKSLRSFIKRAFVAQKNRTLNRIVLAIILLGLGAVLWFALLQPAFLSPFDPPYEIIDRHTIEDFPEKLVRFETVFWDPRDTVSMRRLIRRNPDFAGKDILEIGTGTGLLSFYCINAGAKHVVATDVNPAAIANAEYNERLLGVSERLEVRPVPLDRKEAYSVIAPFERFDYIISNPPWENQSPQTINEYALYDEGFELLRSLLAELKAHLKPGGKAYLAYGYVDAIRHAEKLASQFDLDLRLLDHRPLDTLSGVFLPGMLLEITPNPEI